MTQRFFITATGTDIGKSFVTAALARQAKALGKSVMAYKPVVTGWTYSPPACGRGQGRAKEVGPPSKNQELAGASPGFCIPPASGGEGIETSDTATLLRALDLPLTPENIARVSPWRYDAPLAPSMAARLENRPIDFDMLAAWSRKAMNGPEDIAMIEGVGGVMVPLDDRHTILDWMAAAEIPALLVTGSYLGTISHTLTALAALEQRKIPVHALIVNETENSPVDLAATAEELARWTKAPVVFVARRNAKDGWKDVSELRAVFSLNRYPESGISGSWRSSAARS